MDEQRTEVPPEEEIAEGGSPQEKGESDGVPVASAGVEDERITRLEQRIRDLQSKADRAEAELKRRERAEMDEVERLKAEIADLEAERAQAESLASHWYFENLKRELAAEFGIKPKLAKFITGFDETELRKNARELAELIAEEGEKKAIKQAEEEERRQKEAAPTVPGGSGLSPDLRKEENELREHFIKTGDLKPWLKWKREHRT